MPLDPLAIAAFGSYVAFSWYTFESIYLIRLAPPDCITTGSATVFTIQFYSVEVEGHYHCHYARPAILSIFCKCILR